MKKYLLSFTLFMYLCFTTSIGRASHISGGEITYQCLGSNQYQIILNLYRDCSGIDMSPLETITVSGSCGTQTLTATLLNPGGTEISQICSSQAGNTTCNGGSLPGMQKYTYEAVVTLSPCNDWAFSWSSCCRTTTINIPTSSGDGLYLEATLNNIVDSCDISPAFFAQPIPSVCVNQPVTYNLSASNNDGDSLVFSFIASRNDVITPLIYTVPYSATNPINGITINPGTGTINFTPTTLGNFIVVVQIAEYDSSGVLIGTVMRDIQFIVVSCSDVAPTAASGVISGLSGTAVATSSYSLQLCSGGNFSFNVLVDDTNTADSVLLTSDISSVLPGATFNTINGNPATATISWNDTGSFTGTRNFVITAQDNVCPVPGTQTFIYSVTINDGTYASQDVTICGNQQAQLIAIGGNSFQWSVISGDPIALGTNFSCNPCANPLAMPDTTTAYVVTSNLSGGCTNKDTVIVLVVPDFAYTKTQSETSVCMQEQVQFVVNAAGTNSFQWAPSSIFDNATINNPIATFNSGGTNSVYFTITDSAGCSITDSMSVAVSMNLKPAILIVADSTICTGSNAPMEAITTNVIPSTCGLSAFSCQGSSSQIIVGTGTGVLNNTSYPAPYGNWYEGAKHQILFTATELNTLGFQGGLISSLALDVANISGTTTYNNFEIKMGCTSLTSLSNWQTGLVTVFPAQTVNIATGWNAHTFSTGFDWDGVSNIIVEICFNNQPIQYTNNSPTYYSITSFNSVLYYYADNNPTVCSSPGSVTSSANRPNILFSVCSGGSNSGFSYTWSPAYGLNDATVSNPVASISSDTTYTVIVLDTIGGCSDTASIHLQIAPDFTYTKTQSDTTVCLQENVQFSVTPTAGTYTYQWNPASIFNNSTISNPTGTFDTSGVQTVYFTVSNSSGCDKTDSLSVLVGPSSKPNISILADTSVCSGENAQLNTYINNFDSTANYSYQWFPSFGLDSSTIPNPVATLSSDTAYSVIVVENIGGCSDTQSINLSVVPSFSYSVIQSDTVACLMEQVQFAVTTLPPGTFFYQWFPSTIFDDNSIPNPMATFSSSGTQTVYFEITSSDGCTRSDSADILISPNAPPNILVTGDSAICPGSSTQLDAVISAVPVSCGLSATACSGTSFQITAGTDSSVLPNTSYPAPYGNFYMGVKHQILFRAAELQSIGFSGGQISSLAFNIASISGTTIYNNFEIKMGCTSDTALTTWETGLVTVFPAQNVSIVTGWNTHVFSTSFDWDGTSNIIVDVCFNNQPTAYTYNSPTYYTATTFNSVVYFNADGNPTICSSPSFNNLSTFRPNVIFSVCNMSGTGTGLSYSWSPATGLNSSTIPNPVASPASDILYTVTVEDTVGGCSNTANINVVINSLPAINLGEDTMFCGTFTLNAGSGFSSYLWSTGSTSQSILVTGIGTYWLKIEDSEGCMNSDTINLTYDTSAVAQITSAPDTVCITDNFIVLTGTPAGGTWTGAGTTANGFFSPNMAGMGTHNIIYSVSINGCTAKDSVAITVDSCVVGMNGIPGKNFGLRIYPNPNNGKFVIQMTGQQRLTNHQIVIFNVLGENIYKTEISNTLKSGMVDAKSEIDLRSFGSGIYFVQVLAGEKVFTQRIVVE